MSSPIILWRQQYKALRRTIIKSNQPSATVVLFDYFGVVAIDPLRRWQAEHRLSPSHQDHITALCEQVDSNKLTLARFYIEVGKLVGKSGKQTEREIRAHSAYNQELLLIIKQLRQNPTIRVGLVSNAHRSLHQGMWHDGTHALFDDILTSQEISNLKPKPDPGIFLLALSRLGGKPHQTIFFDDHQPNVEGAASIGIKAYLFTTAQQCLLDLQKEGLLLAPATLDTYSRTAFQSVI